LQNALFIGLFAYICGIKSLKSVRVVHKEVCMGKSNISFDASFEVAQVTATTPDEFWKQINELAKEGKEVTNICAFVVTTKLS
jgi:hypothetical protein